MASTSSNRGAIMIAAAAVLCGLYLFCPYVYMIPFILATKHGWLPESLLEGFDSFFAPLMWLADHVPIYRKMLDAEFDYFSHSSWIP